LPTWTVGQDVRFRHSSGNIYLQRPNGKELKLDFLLQGKREPDGTLTVRHLPEKPIDQKLNFGSEGFAIDTARIVENLPHTTKTAQCS